MSENKFRQDTCEAPLPGTPRYVERQVPRHVEREEKDLEDGLSARGYNISQVLALEA